jgi:hypothetical protein
MASKYKYSRGGGMRGTVLRAGEALVSVGIFSEIGGILFKGRNSRASLPLSPGRLKLGKQI